MPSLRFTRHVTLLPSGAVTSNLGAGTSVLRERMESMLCSPDGATMTASD